MNEFIRYPSKWDQVERTVEKFLQLREKSENINLRIISTISAYNIVYMKELLDWVKSLGLERVVFNPVVDPEIMKPSNLPEALREETKRFLLGEEGQLKMAGQYLENHPQEFDKKLVEFTQQIARVREIKVRDYLPKLEFLYV